MRTLFAISIFVLCIIAWLNLSLVPSRNRQAKEIVDRHLHSLPLADIEEVTYTGNMSLFRNDVHVDNLHVKAKNAHWNHIQYSDITLDVARIDYDATSAFWHKRCTINAISGIRFSGFMTYDEISSRLADVSVNLVDPVLRYRDGHLYLRAYFSPVKMSLDFDGEMVLTPKGLLEYRIEKILDVDGNEISRNMNRTVLNEPFDFSIQILIMRREIALDDIEATSDGVRISGCSIDDEDATIE